MSTFLPVAVMINIVTKRNSGSNVIILDIISQVTVLHREESGQELMSGTWNQEVKQKKWRNSAYRLASHGLLRLYSTQDLGVLSPTEV